MQRASLHFPFLSLAISPFTNHVLGPSQMPSISGSLYITHPVLIHFTSLYKLIVYLSSNKPRSSPKVIYFSVPCISINVTFAACSLKSENLKGSEASLPPHHCLPCIIRYYQYYVLYVSQMHPLLSIPTAISLVRLTIPEIIETTSNQPPLASLIAPSDANMILISVPPQPPKALKSFSFPILANNEIT